MRDLGFHHARSNATTAQAEEIVIGSRQSAQGQTYAVDYIRQQVIAAVGWDRAMNEGYRIHTTIDAELQKVGGRIVRSASRPKRSSIPVTITRPTQYVATRFRNAEANRRTEWRARRAGIFAGRGHRAR